MLFDLPELEIKVPRAWLIGLGCALLVLAGLCSWSWISRHLASKAEGDARAAELVATREKGAAQAGNKEIERWRAHVTALDRDTAEARDHQAKVDTRLPVRRAQVAQLRVATDPGPNGVLVPPDEMVTRLQALSQSQTELIQTLEEALSSRDVVISDQAAAIDARDQEIAALTDAITHWRASDEAKEKALVAERIARETLKSASRANLWIGRAEGGGAVAGTAYVLHLFGVL